MLLVYVRIQFWPGFLPSSRRFSAFLRTCSLGMGERLFAD